MIETAACAARSGRKPNGLRRAWGRGAPAPPWSFPPPLPAPFFFAGHDRDGGMRRAQWSQAERIAAGVDPRRAIPIHMPRALYATGLLALAAGSLFALRYGLDRRLDLRAPLARIVQDKLGYTEARQAARADPEPAPPEPKRPEETGFSLDEAGQKGPGALDAAPDSALDTVGVPDVDNKTGSRDRKS